MMGVFISNLECGCTTLRYDSGVKEVQRKEGCVEPHIESSDVYKWIVEEIDHNYKEVLAKAVLSAIHEGHFSYLDGDPEDTGRVLIQCEVRFDFSVALSLEEIEFIKTTGLTT